MLDNSLALETAEVLELVNCLVEAEPGLSILSQDYKDIALRMALGKYKGVSIGTYFLYFKCKMLSIYKSIRISKTVYREKPRKDIQKENLFTSKHWILDVNKDLKGGEDWIRNAAHSFRFSAAIAKKWIFPPLGKLSKTDQPADGLVAIFFLLSARVWVEEWGWGPS